MKTALVVDASLALAWLFDEHELADALGAELSERTLAAPPLWRLELVNT